MKQEIKEYIQSIIATDAPKGSDLLEEGREIGREMQPLESRFIRERGVKNLNEWKLKNIEEGKIMWQLILGRPNNKEQIEAIKELYEFTQRLGIECGTIYEIPSMECGLPVDCRKGYTGTTSVVLNSIDDYLEQAESAPIHILFGCHHLNSPNAIATTTMSIKAGSNLIGIFSQYLWHRQGFDDDMAHMADVIKALGILSVFNDKYYATDTYPEDAFGGYFMDVVSVAGYALLEHHLIRNLCGCRSTVNFGGLLGEIPTRIALGVAFQRMLGTEDQALWEMWNGSTTEQWDHDIEGNFGLMDQEALAEILANWHYKLGGVIAPNAITEKVRVAEFKEQLDVLASGFFVEQKAKEWVDLIDWSPIDKIADVIVEQSQIMFNNILEGFKEAGVDIEDPMQIMMILKRFNPGKFEAAFHPSTYNTDSNEIKSFYPTVLGRQTMAMTDEVIDELKEAGKEDCLKGKRVVLGSGDGHTYSVFLLDNVLTAMGAEVVNGGVDLDPVDFLDLADEEGIDNVLVSVHNGQCYDVAKQILELAKDRDAEFNIYMGGQLNAILPGHSESTDMTEALLELGINATNDVIATIDNLSKN